MALIGNYSIHNRTPGRLRGGAIANTIANYGKSSSMRGAETHWGKLVAIPLGYLPPHSWLMPRTIGGLSSFQNMSGSISTSAILALADAISLNTNASLSVSDANLDVLVKISSAISANISMSNADIVALFKASISMSASGSISNANLIIIAGVLLQSNISAGMSIANGNLNFPNIGISSNMSAQAQVTTANLDTLINLVSSMSAGGLLTAVPQTNAMLSSDIGGATPLSPEGLAEAVWNYLQTKTTEPDSMKEALEIVLSNAKLIPAIL